MFNFLCLILLLLPFTTLFNKVIHIYYDSQNGDKRNKYQFQSLL